MQAIKCYCTSLSCQHVHWGWQRWLNTQLVQIYHPETWETKLALVSISVLRIAVPWSSVFSYQIQILLQFVIGTMQKSLAWVICGAKKKSVLVWVILEVYWIILKCSAATLSSEQSSTNEYRHPWRCNDIIIASACPKLVVFCLLSVDLVQKPTSHISLLMRTGQCRRAKLHW